MWAGSYNTVAVAKSGEVPFIFIVTFSYYLVGFFLLPFSLFVCLSSWYPQVLVCGLNNYNQLGVAEVMFWKSKANLNFCCRV